jgi:hypothetical protein
MPGACCISPHLFCILTGMTQTPDPEAEFDVVSLYRVRCDRCDWTQDFEFKDLSFARIAREGHANYHRAADETDPEIQRIREATAKAVSPSKDARLDGEGRLTVQHVTNGRDHDGTEWSKCGLRVPDNAEPAPAGAPVCTTCTELDA